MKQKMVDDDAVVLYAGQTFRIGPVGILVKTAVQLFGSQRVRLDQTGKTDFELSQVAYISRGYQIRWIWTERNCNPLHVLLDQLPKIGELHSEVCRGTDIYDFLPAE